MTHQALVELADKWEREAAGYPYHSEGQHAAAAVRLCARELRDALTAAGQEGTAQSQVTECCGHPIADDERFCRKCGWEARRKAGEGAAQEPPRFSDADLAKMCACGHDRGDHKFPSPEPCAVCGCEAFQAPQEPASQKEK